MSVATIDLPFATFCFRNQADQLAGIGGGVPLGCRSWEETVNLPLCAWFTVVIMFAIALSKH